MCMWTENTSVDVNKADMYGRTLMVALFWNQELMHLNKNADR